MTVFCYQDRTCDSIGSDIVNFVVNFFSCSECVQNFKKEIKKYPVPNNKADEVMWLWELHNDVNKRLAGDYTEDAEIKKIQWPSVMVSYFDNI